MYTAAACTSLPSSKRSLDCKAEFGFIERNAQEGVTSKTDALVAEWGRLAELAKGGGCADDTSKAAFDAASALALFGEGKAVEELLSQGWELVRTDPTVLSTVATTYHRLLIMQRRFDDADGLRAELEFISPIAKISGRDFEPHPLDRARLTWTGETLNLAPTRFEDYTGLVIVGHPGCGFTRAFWDDLDKAPEFVRRSVKDETIWMADSWTKLSAESLSQSAGKAPAMPFHIVWRQSDWPEIGSWSSPSIYRFENGRMVDRMVGWPRETSLENLERLKRLLSEEAR